jgi:phosphoribosylglycinamide formyltransferase-1
MLNIAVLVSGGGTNLQALIDAQINGNIQNGHITLVVASNEKAYALERAKQNEIATAVIARKTFENQDAFDEKLIATLEEHNIDLIVLAGYLSILTKRVTNHFCNRIINVHPALIPSFCGEGYYGLKVHEAALQYGVKLTGATVHFVNEVADGGAIILQKAVAIENGDTPELLQKRVMEQAEWVILPKAVSLFCDGKIKVVDNKTIISE